MEEEPVRVIPSDPVLNVGIGAVLRDGLLHGLAGALLKLGAEDGYLSRQPPDALPQLIVFSLTKRTVVCIGIGQGHGLIVLLFQLLQLLLKGGDQLVL